PYAKARRYGANRPVLGVKRAVRAVQTGCEGSGREPEALRVGGYPQACGNRLVVTDARPSGDARSGADVGADADVGAVADHRTLPDVGVCVDVGVLADHGIRVDPGAPHDPRTGSDLRPGFDIGPGLDECLGVHLRAVRDETPTVDVLAVSQRLA